MHHQQGRTWGRVQVHFGVLPDVIRVSPGHECASRGTAEAKDIVVCELDSARCQRIDIWSLDHLIVKPHVVVSPTAQQQI